MIESELSFEISNIIVEIWKGGFSYLLRSYPLFEAVYLILVMCMVLILPIMCF